MLLFGSNVFLSELQNGLGEGAKRLPFTLAVCVIFRLARFADLGITAMLALGGATFIVISNLHCPILLSLLIAGSTGIVGASINGFFFLKLHVHPLLSSILSMFAGYFLALAIAGGSPLVSLPSDQQLRLSELMCGIIGICILLVLVLGFSTRYGLKLRFAGERPQLLFQLGIQSRKSYFVLIIIGNMLAAFSGALLASESSQSSLNSYKDYFYPTIIALVIGEAICSMLLYLNLKTFKKVWENPSQIVAFLSNIASGSSASFYLMSAIIGVIVERLIFTFSTLWSAQSWTPMFTGFIAALLFVVARHVTRRTHYTPSWSFHDQIK